MATGKSSAVTKEDRWVPSTCYMCYNCCGIRAHVVDGVVTRIEGDPQNPHNHGRLCAKGNAGLMGLYNPNRVTRPLRRTNPKKGIGEDPGWVEISWEEALEIVTAKLREVREDNPRKLLLITLDFQAHRFFVAFALAFGTTNIFRSPAYFCGNGLHSVTYLSHGSCYFDPDVEHCKYLLLVGTGTGFMIHSNAVTLAQELADARARGTKVVVVDPMGTNAASKADEWVAIRPGTDGAFALGMLNVLLNELGLYDTEFLKQHTNAPYLIGSDGHYARDAESSKPLVWDSREGVARPYDSVAVADMAIEGRFQADGREVEPAFQRLKDHVKAYSPERVADITTVDAATVRRIAREFGEAAMIGAKIVIGGKELPYRPAALNFGRGPIAHKHAFLTGYALELLNIVIGAIDVPGGILGVSAVGPFWEPEEGPDGLLVPAYAAMAMMGAYPARPVSRPKSLDLIELFPIAPYSTPMTVVTMNDPEKYGVPFPSMAIHCRTNVMMTSANPDEVASVLSKVPFMVSMACDMDETVEFADIVLPDAHYLERLDPVPNMTCEWIKAGMGDWYWQLRQPVVEPPPGVRHWAETLVDLVDRTGFRKDFNLVFNTVYGVDQASKLEPDKGYDWKELADRICRSTAGPEWGLSSFRERGFVSWPKRVEEAYPRHFLKPRIPVYLEYLIEAGERVKETTAEMGLEWDVSDYQPMPDWKPCPAHEDGSSDLFVVNYKLPFHTFAQTGDNPWLADITQRHPYAYKAVLGPAAARRAGVKDGDLIWIEETTRGYRVKGQAKISECVHPEVIAIAGNFGHWSKAQSIAKGKGIHFNVLLPNTIDRIDMVTAALDSCVKVKVYKA